MARIKECVLLACAILLCISCTKLDISKYDRRCSVDVDCMVAPIDACGCEQSAVNVAERGRLEDEFAEKLAYCDRTIDRIACRQFEAVCENETCVALVVPFVEGEGEGE